MYSPAIKQVAYIAFCGCVLSIILLLRYRARPSLSTPERGACVKIRSRYRLGSRPTLGAVSLAGVRIPASDECRHFKLLGTTGSGKSSAIRELLASAIRRGDRAVFADPDGSYLKAFYRRPAGDILLNPFEADSVMWDLFAEIDSDFAVEQLVQALIPGSQDPSTQEWRGYARTFVAAVIRASMRRPRRNLDELWRLLTRATADELRQLLAGSPAQPFVEAENARMFGSIRAVTSSAVASLDFIRRQHARPFSVRRWVSAPVGTRLLFMPYKANQIAALRFIIAAWLRLAIFESLSGKEGCDQRLWFVIDELDALGAIDSLRDALARLRKFGGRCVVGFQSSSQVSATYQSEANSIIENCCNTLILRCSSSEQGGTSQFASRLIGDREVYRQQIARGVDRDGGCFKASSRRSRSITRQLVTEPAVLAAEIEQLQDLCGYMKTASSRHWLKVKWTPNADLT